MKGNPGTLSDSVSRKITIGNKIIPSCKCEKLLGIKIRNNLVLKGYTESCVKNQVQRLMLCQGLYFQP